METWLMAGAGVLAAGVAIGYFLGYRHGALSGELRALKSMRSSRGRGEHRVSTLSTRDREFDAPVRSHVAP